MRCPRCSADNPAGMNFCGQCAAPLGAACPSCGSSNPPRHRFCGQCGTPLDDSVAQRIASSAPLIPKQAEARAPPEMKQVTVLFCDIVGSTPLSEQL